MKRDIGSESRFLPTTPAFDVPIGGGVAVEYCHAIWYGKTRLKVRLFVLTECTNVTDTRTDGQTDGYRMTAKAALAQQHAAKTF